MPPPIDVCIRGAGITGADAEAEECFWDRHARFRGWQPDAPGVTGYARYLREIAGFLD